jgi:hypothetical protein
MAKKFILTKDYEIRLGHVDFHKELHKDPTQILGGGWWEWVLGTEAMLFYGKSEDFGPVKVDDLKKAWSYQFRGHEVFFYSEELFLKDALRYNQILNIEIDD